MTNTNVLTRLTDRCDIYFAGSLISKELIIEKYSDFLAHTLSSEEHSVSIALHTGSVCFDTVSFLTAALGSLSLDMTTPEQIISSLNIGELVMYKNQRYRWRGVESKDGETYLKIEQDGCGKIGKYTRFLPYDNHKNLVKPYYGPSGLTDGRGIRKVKSHRADFISYIFEIPTSEIPSITGVSTVIVTERNTFDRISKELEIIYGEDKHIGLLDIVTASYYTDSGVEYPYGRNPAKAEPVLKITRKISTARDLVLDKRGNKVVGLLIIGSDAMAKGSSELTDLLDRKSLCFAHVAAGMDSKNAENIIEIQENAAIFACTKEFLLQNTLPPHEHNPLTIELDKQVETILNNTVTVINVDGGCSWDDLKKAREALYTIKNSEWNEERKNGFIISAYSLLNLFITAVFSMQTLEKAVKFGKLHIGVASPALRIRELRGFAESAKTMEYNCAFVVDVLEHFYRSMLSQCPKYDALKEYLDTIGDKKVAVVVPKAYYANILIGNERFNKHNVNIVTTNRFDSTIDYDKIIVVGNINGLRFDPLKCKSAEDIIVFLYECETHMFMHKKHKADNFEKKLNSRLGIIEDDYNDVNANVLEDDAEHEEMDALVESVSDLERYIDEISIFDIGKFAAQASGSSGNAPTSEICAIGRFTSGEHILFSKYYDAVVFDSEQGAVTETDTENLVAGDLLVFAKRDDYTQNMVDYIYESLLSTGRLSKEVLDATRKALYWKEVLRKYKNDNELTYRDIAKGLRRFGSSLQEVSIRQWLIEESHIVGPRDEKTLEQIAKLTRDPYLLSDTHGYFEACRIVRRQRKEILGLIGKAITNRISGHIPPNGSVLEVVYENVENLSEILELDNIFFLDDPMTVLVNIINKPMTDAEVSI